MKFQPEKQIKNAVIFSLICFLLAAVLIIISVLVTLRKSVYQITAVVFATVCIQVTSRFILTDYVYALENDTFTVTKINGKKYTEICGLSLKTAIKAGKNLSYAEVKKDCGTVNLRFNFCQNMRPAEYTGYVFEFNGKTAYAVFDYNEIFHKEFIRLIEVYKENE